MSLVELAAFEAAYRVLEPLEPSSRRRALQWLSDVLGQSSALAEAASAAGVTEPAASPAKRGRPRSTPQTSAATGGRRGRGPSKAKAAQNGASNGRAYRRMPEADEVMAVYRKVGSIAELADHFDVPAYTAHSWARRLRSLGYQIGRQG